MSGAIEQSFEYVATDPAGETLHGTIAADDLSAARRKLEGVGLSIVRIDALPATTPVATPLSAADLLAFNEQFAQLATAGLPIEYGLRLIADDLRHGRLAENIRMLAAELDRGTPLAEAFAHHAGNFPPLYARLVEAGVRSNSLGGLLLNLGRHLETMQKFRAALWRTFTYPLIVLSFLAIAVVFISYYVLPQFSEMFVDVLKSPPPTHFDFATMDWVKQPPLTLPWLTSLVLMVGRVLPEALLVLLAAAAVTTILVRRRGNDDIGLERIKLRLPFVGQILRQNLLARWCDAAALATSAGIDLDASLQLAADAVHSPSLTRDTKLVSERIQSGQPIDSPAQYAVLPSTIPAAIELASRKQHLPQALRSLGEFYERQCRLRLENFPAVMSPILLGVIAALVGTTIIALILPLVKLIEYFGR